MVDDSGNVVLPQDTGEHGKDVEACLSEGGRLRDGQLPAVENVETGGEDPPLLNDPNCIAPGIADASAIEHEQTERLQPSTQENGTPTGTINEDINPDDTRGHKADAATV